MLCLSLAVIEVFSPREVHLSLSTDSTSGKRALRAFWERLFGVWKLENLRTISGESDVWLRGLKSIATCCNLYRSSLYSPLVESGWAKEIKLELARSQMNKRASKPEAASSNAFETILTVCTWKSQEAAAAQ